MPPTNATSVCLEQQNLCPHPLPCHGAVLGVSRRFGCGVFLRGSQHIWAAFTELNYILLLFLAGFPQGALALHRIDSKISRMPQNDSQMAQRPTPFIYHPLDSIPQGHNPVLAASRRVVPDVGNQILLPSSRVLLLCS